MEECRRSLTVLVEVPVLVSTTGADYVRCAVKGLEDGRPRRGDVCRPRVAGEMSGGLVCRSDVRHFPGVTFRREHIFKTHTDVAIMRSGADDIWPCLTVTIIYVTIIVTQRFLRC